MVFDPFEESRMWSGYATEFDDSPRRVSTGRSAVEVYQARLEPLAAVIIWLWRIGARGRSAPAWDGGGGPPTPGNQACLGTDLLASSSTISNTVALHVGYS